jgi:hypothetical protein
MQISGVRNVLIAIFAVAIILVIVVFSIIEQEREKDDCRAQGGFVTEVHGNGGQWICSQQGAQAPTIIMNNTRRTYR